MEVKSFNSSTTDFDLVVSGSGGTFDSQSVSYSSPWGPNYITGSSSTTITMTVTGGYVPPNAFLSGAGPSIQGSISGDVITFSDVNLSSNDELTIYLDEDIK